MLAHPLVHDAAVVAMPDPLLGERTCAFVVARAPAPSRLVLKRYLRDCETAAFKIPDRIEFMPRFRKPASARPARNRCATAAPPVAGGGRMSARPTDSTWIRELRLSPCPRAQLVCFPHAGGTANFFRGWSRALPWDVDLLALQYPGREERFGEPCLTSIDALAGPAADALQRYAHAPLVLFGHSLGAALAYEVAARLEARGAAPFTWPSPRCRRRIASACRTCTCNPTMRW